MARKNDDRRDTQRSGTDGATPAKREPPQPFIPCESQWHADRDDRLQRITDYATIRRPRFS